MAQKPAALSEEMYIRIFRLVKRGIDVVRIASTVQLPIETVQHIVTRINNSSGGGESGDTGISQTPAHESDEEQFLDIYLAPQHNYVIIEMSGSLINYHEEKIVEKFRHILQSKWKAVAIRLSDVREIDAAAVELLLQYKREFSAKGYYMALLDPSPVVDRHITETGLDEQIPVFGTEIAFSENVLSIKRGQKFK